MLLAKLDRLLRKNYALDTLLRSRRFERALPDDPEPIVIYQMGKVGSTSIYKSLRTRLPERQVHHVHFLTPQGIDFAENIYRRASQIRGANLVYEQMLSSHYLRRVLDREYQTRRWKIISLVRDPVPRNMSSFFQTFHTQFAEDYMRVRRGELRLADRVPQLIAQFLHQWHEHDVPLTWFEDHVQPVFGIDVYAAPFPRDVGWQIIRQGNVDFLLFRLEDLDRAARPAFEAFLGIPDFSPDRRNIGEDKDYAEAYRAFRGEIHLPDEYLDRMYRSQYMRHFYSEDEADKFRARWQRV